MYKNARVVCKFNLINSSGSAVMKKLLEEGVYISCTFAGLIGLEMHYLWIRNFFPLPHLCFSILAEIVNPLMPGGNKRSYIFRQTCSKKLKVCLSMYDLLLPPGVKGSKNMRALVHHKIQIKNMKLWF